MISQIAGLTPRHIEMLTLLKGKVDIVPNTFTDIGELFGLDKGEVRGMGQTTHQMKHAPQGADFVWCSRHTDYPEDVKNHLGRLDLTVRPAQWFRTQLDQACFRGYRNCIVVDHSFDYRFNR